MERLPSETSFEGLCQDYLTKQATSCGVYLTLYILNSQSYFEAAKEKFAIFKSKMSFRLLGTEKKNPVEQGYEAEHYGLHYMANYLRLNLEEGSHKEICIEKKNLEHLVPGFLETSQPVLSSLRDQAQ